MENGLDSDSRTWISPHFIIFSSSVHHVSSFFIYLFISDLYEDHVFYHVLSHVLLCLSPLFFMFLEKVGRSGGSQGFERLFLRA